MSDPVELILADADATTALGGALAGAVAEAHPGGFVIWLEGDLGTGKTTLVRGLLRGLGHAGRVPSPTYTLVEPYALGGWQVYHVDLYRLDEPRDVEQLGLGELARPGHLLLIEWPDRGAGHLPPADLEIALSMAQAGRRIRLTPRGATASAAVGRLSASNPL